MTSKRLFWAAVALLGSLALPTLAATSTAPDHLGITDERVGQGAVAQPGDTVQVSYTGWLYDPGKPDHRGAQFDASEEGQPISFPLGNGVVIAGWDQGIAGMHVGGRRELVIPARLGYGSHGAGEDIPPNAALVFEVELVGVQHP